MRQRHNARQAFYSQHAVEFLRRPAHVPPMTKAKQHKFNRSRVFLREWRKFRGLTQEQVAERTEIDQSTVQRIEAGKLPYNEETLERFALAFGCEVTDILSINPLKPDVPRLVYDRLRAAPKDVQERALAILEVLLKAG